MAQLPADTTLAQAILRLPDWVIAELYSAWSEETFAVGWMRGAEGSFVSHLLGSDSQRYAMSAQYERDSVAAIRKLLGEV